MKKILILILFAFTLTSAFGQELTVKDLIKLNTTSFESFDEFVKQKGYAWSRTKNRGQKGIAIYSWQENSKGQSSRWLIKETHSLLQNVVKFHTNRANEYDTVKNGLKKNGFEPNSSERLPGGGLSEIFTNDNMHLILRIKPGTRSTFYEIEIQAFK
jgi:hypothetical protein